MALPASAVRCMVRISLRNVSVGDADCLESRSRPAASPGREAAELRCDHPWHASEGLMLPSCSICRVIQSLSRPPSTSPPP